MKRLCLCLAAAIGASPFRAETPPDVAPVPAEATPAPAPPVTDEIQFFNHDKLHGFFLGYDLQGGVYWQVPGSKNPAIFRTGNIMEVVLDSRHPPANTASPSHLVTLTNDDELRGVLVSLDDQTLVLDTWYAGRLAIRRGMIKSITTLIRAADLVYEGPDGMDGWTTNPPEMDYGKMLNHGMFLDAPVAAGSGLKSRGWYYHGGAFVSNDYGIIGRDVKLPAIARAEFDLVTGGQSQVTVGLYADQINDMGDCYMFRINRGFMFIRRALKSNFAATPPIELPGDPAQRRKLHFDIRMNRYTRTFLLFVNGVLLKQWTDPDEFSGKGTSLLFICHRDTYASVGNISIASWDFKTSASDPAKPKSNEDYIVMGNMDTISGKLKGFANGKVKFSSPYADLDIPFERIATITMPDEHAALAARGEDDIRGWFPGRGSVTMKLESWDGKQVVASSPNFVGKVTFSPDAFQRLQFNLGRQSATGDASP